MTVLISKRVDRFQTEKVLHIVDYQDVLPGDARVLEAETDLGYSLGNPVHFLRGNGPPVVRRLRQETRDMTIGGRTSTQTRG